jgi:coenzyme F420 hydrogenase subunit beta
MDGEDRPAPAPGAAPRWDATWSDLAGSVVGTGRCSGCGGCVIACPWGVLSLDGESWAPRLTAAARVPGAVERCVHQERGCTLCARACPRFGDWEADGDLAALGRRRGEDELLGVCRALWLVSATDPEIAAVGQDGGLATALLAYALEHDIIDAALVSHSDEGMRPRPGVARSRAELLAAAGSRYTYSPNPLAYAEAARLGADRIGLVGVGCQASVPAVAGARGVRRVARRFALVIGLLCSRTFTDGLFAGLLEPRLGIPREQVRRMNIKGRLQVWATDERGAALRPLRPAGVPPLPGLHRRARRSLPRGYRTLARSDLHHRAQRAGGAPAGRHGTRRLDHHAPGAGGGSGRGRADRPPGFPPTGPLAGRRLSRLRPSRAQPSRSSIRRGQSSLSRRLSARSARTRPPVWQRGQ